MNEINLKEIIINSIPEEMDLDDLDGLVEMEFYTWLIWALGLCNN